MRALIALAAVGTAALIGGIATTRHSDAIPIARERAADTPFTGCMDHVAATRALSYAGYDIADTDGDALTSKWTTTNRALPSWIVIKYTNDDQVCLADYDRTH